MPTPMAVLVVALNARTFATSALSTVQAESLRVDLAAKAPVLIEPYLRRPVHANQVSPELLALDGLHDPFQIATEVALYIGGLAIFGRQKLCTACTVPRLVRRW